MLSAGCSAVRGATMAHRLGRLIQRRIATELLSTRTTSGTPAASTASLEQVRTDQPAIFSGPHASHKRAQPTRSDAYHQQLLSEGDRCVRRGYANLTLR